MACLAVASRAGGMLGTKRRWAVAQHLPGSWDCVLRAKEIVGSLTVSESWSGCRVEGDLDGTWETIAVQSG